MFLLLAISLGFLGSFHCIGMCGPIALAIPLKSKSFFGVFISSLLYNLGRVTTYATLGFFFGFLGKGFAIAGWQNILSISLGLSLLIILFVNTSRINLFGKSGILVFLEKIKAPIRRLFGINTYSSLFLIGLLNGLLPCGLVYLGIAGSMATLDPWKASLFMAAFGMGTLPAMLIVSAARNFISIRFREQIRRLMPIIVAMMALLLILRGMNLGIPYISPLVENDSGMVHHQCCSKPK